MKTHKKLLMTAILAGILLSPSAYAMHAWIKLPDAESLTQQLNEGSFGQFVRDTPIIAELAGKNISPVGLQMQVNLLLTDYANRVKGKNPIFANIIQARESSLTKLILQKYPEAIAELEANGLLQ